MKRQIGSSFFQADQSYDSLGRVDIVKCRGSIAGIVSTAPEADANHLRVRNNHNDDGFGCLASVSDVDAGSVHDLPRDASVVAVVVVLVPRAAMLHGARLNKRGPGYGAQPPSTLLMGL